MTFRLTDSNEQRLYASVEKVQHELSRIDAVTNVLTDLDETIQEIQIEVDREKAKDYGFVPAQIAQTVNQMTKGQLTTQMIDDGGTVLSVYTGFGQAFNESMDALKAMKLRSPAGLFVKLDEIANVSIQEAPD
ncbi:Multidrug resistance protein MdtC OS=Lysinibacillus sphaericus OX=1421 GN=mdtC PE=4 SV=1 [Lysinibacillus sphaericus]